MMKQLFVLLLLGVGASSIAQVKFQKTYGGSSEEHAYDIIINGNGEYVYTGFTASYGAGSKDMYLVKTNTDGDTLFTKTFGGTSGEEGRALEQTADNGYIIAGSTNSFGAGQSDVYLVKTDANGNMQWSKAYGTPDFDYGMSVHQTTDGGYIVAGYFWDVQLGFQAYVIKTNSTGATTWTKQYGGTNSLADLAYDIVEVGGGYVFVGYSVRPVPNNENIYITKINTTGDVVWSKIYGGGGSDYGYAIRETSDNGFIIAGATNSFGAGGYDMYLIRTDSNGDTLWTRAYGGNLNDFALSLEIDQDGGYALVGYTFKGFGTTQNDVMMIKTNSDGALQWGTTFGWSGSGYEQGDALKEAATGYIVAGYSDSYGQGQGDAYLIKIDDQNYASCSEQGISATESLVPTVAASGTNATNSGFAELALSNSTQKTNTIVETVCYCNGPLAIAAFTQSITGLTVDFTDQTTGSPISWNWDFGDTNTDNVQNPSHTYASNGTYYVCLIATNSCGQTMSCDSVPVYPVGIAETPKEVSVSIYPNPASNLLNIKVKNANASRAVLTNLIGEKVIDVLIEDNNVKILTESLSEGIYLLRVETTQGIITRKIAISR